jgi:hypothetical protein
MQTQEVAKAYGAVCTPDFYLFKKEYPFAWHVLSTEGYLQGVGRFWILSPSELFGTLTSEDPTEDIPWNIQVNAGIFCWDSCAFSHHHQHLSANILSSCVFQQDGRRPFELVYHGQFDNSRPCSNTPITGRSELQHSLNLLQLECG